MSALGSLNLHAGTVFGNGTYTGSAYGYVGGSNNGYGTTNTYALERQGAYCASAEDQDYEIILKYLEDGKTETALKMYEDLCTEYGDSAAAKGFKRVAGTSMMGAVEQTCSGSFWTGVKEGLPIFGWFANGTSEQEAVAELADEKVSFKDKFVEATGATLSGGATGAAIGAGVGSVVPVVGTAAGAIIGGIVGAIGGIVKTFVK